MEENLVIIALNLALSRAIYSFFSNGACIKAEKPLDQNWVPYTRRQLEFERKRGLGLSPTPRSRDSMIPMEEATRKARDLAVTRESLVTREESAASIGQGNNPYLGQDSVWGLKASIQTKGITDHMGLQYPILF